MDEQLGIFRVGFLGPPCSSFDACDAISGICLEGCVCIGGWDEIFSAEEAGRVAMCVSRAAAQHTIKAAVWPADENGYGLNTTGGLSFCCCIVGQAPEGQQWLKTEVRQHGQRQAHWRPGPHSGLVGHSKDGELSLCRDLILAVSTALPGTALDWLAAAPGFRWLFHAVP